MEIVEYIYVVQNSLNKSFGRILYSLNFSGPAGNHVSTVWMFTRQQKAIIVKIRVFAYDTVFK